ncbi:hypothetical protein M0813_22751 [Anaeramoeba flamelloides]|uniref:Uncharacterized protein n=1 Tax=Anaeramoeba flamelloides TaxID=1746091 RepID=A0ABQ8YCI5_9EUKA|nr:hypothetical protein M0813_22751 [Anaeramoeba flamelloides]
MDQTNIEKKSQQEEDKGKTKTPTHNEQGTSKAKAIGKDLKQQFARQKTTKHGIFHYQKVTLDDIVNSFPPDTLFGNLFQFFVPSSEISHQNEKIQKRWLWNGDENEYSTKSDIAAVLIHSTIYIPRKGFVRSSNRSALSEQKKTIGFGVVMTFRFVEKEVTHFSMKRKNGIRSRYSSKGSQPIAVVSKVNILRKKKDIPLKFKNIDIYTNTDPNTNTNTNTNTNISTNTNTKKEVVTKRNNLKNERKMRQSKNNHTKYEKRTTINKVKTRKKKKPQERNKKELQLIPNKLIVNRKRKSFDQINPEKILKTNLYSNFDTDNNPLKIEPRQKQLRVNPKTLNSNNVNYFKTAYNEKQILLNVEDDNNKDNVNPSLLDSKNVLKQDDYKIFGTQDKELDFHKLRDDRNCQKKHNPIIFNKSNQNKTIKKKKIFGEQFKYSNQINNVIQLNQPNCGIIFPYSYDKILNYYLNQIDHNEIASTNSVLYLETGSKRYELSLNTNGCYGLSEVIKSHLCPHKELIKSHDIPMKSKHLISLHRNLKRESIIWTENWILFDDLLISPKKFFVCQKRNLKINTFI